MSVTIRPEDIRAAAARIAPHIRQTPVLRLPAGVAGPGAVVLKLEHLQASGSFKLRGALNALIAGQVPAAGAIAVSGGNHGAAVALAARLLGHRATVVAPDYAGAVKLERMRGFGAEVIEIPGPATEAFAAFEHHARHSGALRVHPFDDPLVMAGQGTLGMELEPETLDTLIVSVGGGGLAGGIAGWFQGRVRLIAVETEGTATLATALAQGPGAVIAPAGIAASALGAPSIGRAALDLLTRTGAQSVLVSDAAVRAAAQRLWAETRLCVEPGAATALAALTSGAYVPRAGERMGVVLCGGNAAPDWFA